MNVSAATEAAALKQPGRKYHSLSRNAAMAIVFATIAVALVCIASFAAASYASVDSQTTASLAAETERYAAEIERAGYTGNKLVSFLKEQSALIGDDRRITLISSDGTVLYDSDVEDVSSLDNHAERPEVQQAEATGEAAAGRYSETLQEVTLYHTVRLSSGDVLRFATTQSSVMGVVLGMLGPCALVVLLALIAALLASRFLARVISDDLSRIDLDAPLDNDAPEELLPLLARLNAQHVRLEAQASERRQYTANVSHELKTPLTVISGYAEMIEKGIAKPKDVTVFARTIHDEAQRMKGMVDDVISLSRLDDMGAAQREGLTPGAGYDMNQDVSLEKVASDVSAHLRPYAQGLNVDLTVAVKRFNNEPIMVRGNERVLGELVRNLAENAVRYNVEGGTAQIQVEGAEDGASVVRVSDTGIGIAPELRERVFERFFRVDESRSKETGGSGLGLAIVKHAAQVHGASIVVSGNEPQGTVIEVRFPFDEALTKP